MKPKLSLERLFEGGFKEAGCWELNNARDLALSIDLPGSAGVYAFAIDGIVQYVGLASKSLRQRLAHYRRPGPSQRTNIRLNEVIRAHLAAGTIVHIVTCQPPDHEWNGFTIKGAEGLEAGLIAEFHLPWNVRGAVTSVAPGRRPGMTELEIARAVLGPRAVQPQVNPHCRRLVREGRVERHGSGGIANPYVYRARD